MKIVTRLVRHLYQDSGGIKEMELIDEIKYSVLIKDNLNNIWWRTPQICISTLQQLLLTQNLKKK